MVLLCHSSVDALCALLDCCALGISPVTSYSGVKKGILSPDLPGYIVVPLIKQTESMCAGAVAGSGQGRGILQECSTLLDAVQRENPEWAALMNLLEVW